MWQYTTHLPAMFTTHLTASTSMASASLRWTGEEARGDELRVGDDAPLDGGVATLVKPSLGTCKAELNDKTS